MDSIREGAIASLMDYKGFDRAPTEYIIDHVLNYLKSRGLVQVVEGELPENPYDISEDYDYHDGVEYYKGKLAGYRLTKEIGVDGNYCRQVS